MYYLRTRAAADAIKFTVDQQALTKKKAARAAKSAADLAASSVTLALKVQEVRA
jgi:ribonucleoside-diphosphate reductase subunit M1